MRKCHIKGYAKQHVDFILNWSSYFIDVGGTYLNE